MACITFTSVQKRRTRRGRRTGPNVRCQRGLCGTLARAAWLGMGGGLRRELPNHRRPCCRRRADWTVLLGEQRCVLMGGPRSRSSPARERMCHTPANITTTRLQHSNMHRFVERVADPHQAAVALRTTATRLPDDSRWGGHNARYCPSSSPAVVIRMARRCAATTARQVSELNDLGCGDCCCAGQTRT